MDLQPYLTNLDFWVRGEEQFMKEISGYVEAIETTDDKSPFYRLNIPVSHLLDSMFMQFLSLTPLKYRPSFGEDEGKEPRVQLVKKYKYYVAGVYVTGMVKDPLKPDPVFMVVHAHAPAALSSVEYLKVAETFMKDKLLRWLHTADKMMYGLIFVGGKVAMYNMDKTTSKFNRIVDGKPEAVRSKSLPEAGMWKSISDTEVMKSLFGIIQQEWCRLDEQDLRETIEIMKVQPTNYDVYMAREDRKEKERPPSPPFDPERFLQQLDEEFVEIIKYCDSETEGSSDSSKENSPVAKKIQRTK